MTYRDADVPPRSRRALETLALLSKKWHPAVVVTVQHHGPLGFNDLLELLPDVSGKVLTGTLDELQDADLIERRVVNESPLRVEYDLTEAGRDIESVLDALGEWGERHLDTTTATILLADPDRRITGMYRQWLVDQYTVLRAHDADELDTHLDDDIDVVLLDGGLHGTDPEAVVADCRADCRVVLLVDARPDFDLLEVACDDLLPKPIVRSSVVGTITEQLSRQGEPVEQRDLASLAVRQSLFETVYAPERLEANDTFQRLRDRRAKLLEHIENE
jgi:DNA-binding HxlR family transcriptional regulator